MKKIIVALDGPAGSGKTSTAKIVAEKLDYIYIDTGAMYRAVTLFWLESKEELIAENAQKIMDKVSIELKQSDLGLRTILNTEDVSDAIREPRVTENVSFVSSLGYIRETLVNQQRIIAKNGGCVMDGRDIGTVVFPDAELKVFFTATPEVRANRRMKELEAKGLEVNFEELRQQIIDRDNYDSNREIAPLKQAEDAILMDTSDMNLYEQAEKVVKLALDIIK
jgi:cytidylate kinase